MFTEIKKYNKTLAAVAVATVLSVPMSSYASESKGYLAGKSLSEQGTVVTNVTVTVTNKQTGLTRTVTTDEQGGFRFPLLPPGQYIVEAKKDGFSTVRKEDLVVGPSGRVSVNLSMPESSIERIVVSGANISTFDVTSSESQLVVNQDFINKVPVPRDITSVALLAPGTVAGDSDFGNLASFGGSSVAENTYYVNGMNVTNFRDGLGGAELPFEMYDTFEIKTGGYSAEFGRSTGGVVNATTKRGTNEFKWGASAFYEPASLAEQSPNVYRTDLDNIEEAGSALYQVFDRDYTDTKNFNLWASGALIEDKLFFFGLVNQQNRKRDYANTSLFYDRDGSDTLYALKLDWNITDEHILELTAWDNSEDLDTTKFLYNADKKEIGASGGDYIRQRGGKSWALQYTGIITDDLTISALYGVNEASYSNVNVGSNPTGDKAVVYERFSGKEFGAFGLFSPTVEEDERTAMRFDVDWYVSDDHTLRFGIDYEKMEAVNNTQRAGGVAYRYEGCDSDALAQNQLDCTDVRVEYYVNRGDFETKSSAYYIEDTWTITDNITARIGLRNETFENFNKAGLKFVDVDNQWAPRLGISWDINGDGESKVFANFGRYFLPVATNTNVRLAGDELYTRQYFEVESINADYTPNLVPGSGGSISTFGNGLLKNTDETVNANIDPMYQDEFILGYQQMVNDLWKVGVKATYRKLGSSLEDVAIDAGLNAYIEQEFGSSCTLCTSGFHYYVLTNPGTDVTITTDPDGDGPVPLGTYTVPAEMLGYPEAERQYASVDFVVDRHWDEKWMASFTYTWSHSWGNNEGGVRSDNDQTDTGLTTNFDQPGLTDGAYGNLPNDRRHSVKINGAYQVSENFSLGANFNFTSGRPLNSFGHHPTDAFASLYNTASFVKDGQLVGRGSEGRTPNTWQLDLTANYIVYYDDTPITLRADIFNVFNNDQPTQLNEDNDRFSHYEAHPNPNGVIARGEPNPTYGLPTAFQRPRSVRFSVNVAF